MGTPDTHRPWTADPERYDGRMPYRRVGRSGLQLPAISLGLWHNFGDHEPIADQRAILRRAFDLGVTHFDLANNYGPPYGSAETNFGRILREDLKPYRNELVISTKAGWDMWPGPYGMYGSRKYLLQSLDESLTRMGLDHVDIFYSHRFDPDTPLEETCGALDAAVRQGKALYVGISSYSGRRTTEAIEHLREDFKPYRDELVVSTKAGWDMWPGPYGQGGGSRKYMLASLDQSLRRMGLDYVDIFYHHRPDPSTPLEETMGALHSAVQQGKALYVGISSYPAELAREAAGILADLGTPLLIHQPSYSMLNRWIEEDLLDVLDEEGVGSIVFTPLAQGLLTDKYLDGIPEGSRAGRDEGVASQLTDENLDRIRGLNEIAKGRGQSLAQMAIAWTLRDPRVTSSLIGASSVRQLEDSLGALENLDFGDDELEQIDRHAVDGGVNWWAGSAELE
jgi:L-glyceraldehyde 3-phosphate reductase